MKYRDKDKALAEILEKLKTVSYPGYSRDIVSFGFVKSVSVDDSGRITVEIEVSTTRDDVVDEIRRRVGEALEGRDDVSFFVRRKEDVRKVQLAPVSIAVYSTKGGVGKSTFAVNLAFSMARLGKRVAILDLDFFGPSVPRLTGTEGYELCSKDGRSIEPVERFGVRIMSVGFMAKGDTPVAWRGPMVVKALRTIISSTRWEKTDVLVIDLPPGSGDVHLSVAQELQISGVLFITTPQELALEDVRRGISMFRKLSVPILGVVENMSYFLCDFCGRKHFLFGRGGGRKLAEEYGIELIGEIPFDGDMMEMSDRGMIYVLERKGGISDVFLKIAGKLIERLGSR